jgi:V8-like Glu-specific endopeptidase
MGRTRQKTTRTARGAVLLAAAIAAASIAAPAAAQAASGPVHAGDTERTAAQVSAYWTKERMRNAEPVEMVIPTDDPSPPDPVPVPIPSAGLIAFELPETTSFPNRVHGKVFFTKAGGGNFVCSGTAVLAANDATVLTAGHCVADNGAFVTNLSFVPGYRNGTAPYGVWAASAVGSTPQWIAAENFKYDVGVAVMARNSSGEELEDVVGARGILFNQPVSGTVRSYGYPAGPPFDGSKLFGCDAPLGALDLNPLLPPGGPLPMQVVCDMTGGSSGGGWVTDSGNGSVISVNSYKYQGQPIFMYGPQLTGVAETLYNSLEGVPPGTPLSPAAGGAPQQPPSSTAAQPAAAPTKTKPRCRKATGKGKKKRKRRCRVRA